MKKIKTKHGSFKISFKVQDNSLYFSPDLWFVSNILSSLTNEMPAVKEYKLRPLLLDM